MMYIATFVLSLLHGHTVIEYVDIFTNSCKNFWHIIQLKIFLKISYIVIFIITYRNVCDVYLWYSISYDESYLINKISVYYTKMFTKYNWSYMFLKNVLFFHVVGCIIGWENLGNILFNISYAVYSIYFIYNLKIYSSKSNFPGVWLQFCINLTTLTSVVVSRK